MGLSIKNWLHQPWKHYGIIIYLLFMLENEWIQGNMSIIQPDADDEQYAYPVSTDGKRSSHEEKNELAQIQQLVSALASGIVPITPQFISKNNELKSIPTWKHPAYDHFAKKEKIFEYILYMIFLDWDKFGDLNNEPKYANMDKGISFDHKRSGISKQQMYGLSNADTVKDYKIYKTNLLKQFSNDDIDKIRTATKLFLRNIENESGLEYLSKLILKIKYTLDTPSEIQNFLVSNCNMLLQITEQRLGTTSDRSDGTIMTDANNQ